MGFLVYEDEVDRIERDFPKGHVSVDIKRKIAFGDKEYLAEEMLKQVKINPRAFERGRIEKDDIDISTVKLTPGKAILYERIIKAWNITDREGNIAPITRETIAMLDEDVGNWIDREIEARNRPLLASARRSIKKSGRS